MIFTKIIENVKEQLKLSTKNVGNCFSGKKLEKYYCKLRKFSKYGTFAKLMCSQIYWVGGISWTMGFTEVVHLSKFAGFFQESNEMFPVLGQELIFLINDKKYFLKCFTQKDEFSCAK